MPAPKPDTSNAPATMGPLPILRYDPTARGLARWFGPTSTMVMAIVWSEQRAMTVRAIGRELESQGHSVAYTTAQTTITRLWEKGLFHREWIGGAYVYTVRESMDQFVTRNVNAIRSSL